MSTEQSAKELIKSARELVKELPNKSAEEIAKIATDEMVYPNRSNEGYVAYMSNSILSALQLVIDHPNSLDGILARKLEEKIDVQKQELLNDPQLLAQVSSYAIALVITQFLESGNHSREEWRNFGDQIIAHPEFKEKISGDAVEEFGDLFMGAWGMEAQDGFAYTMENINPEKSPNLLTSLSTHTKEVTKSSLKV